MLQSNLLNLGEKDEECSLDWLVNTDPEFSVNSRLFIEKLSDACSFLAAELHSSVGSVADLRIGDLWFDPRLAQYSFQGLMIVIATGFIPLSPLSVVSTMVKWESSQWLGKNIVRSTG